MEENLKAGIEPIVICRCAVGFAQCQRNSVFLPARQLNHAIKISIKISFPCGHPVAQSDVILKYMCA